jgi:hypothetical protein
MGYSHACRYPADYKPDRELYLWEMPSRDCWCEDEACEGCDEFPCPHDTHCSGTSDYCLRIRSGHLELAGLCKFCLEAGHMPAWQRPEAWTEPRGHDCRDH